MAHVGALEHGRHAGRRASDHASWPRPTSTATTCGRAGLQQAVGEPAGRRAGVEGPAAPTRRSRSGRARPRASRRHGRRTGAVARVTWIGSSAVDQAGGGAGRAARRRGPARRRSPRPPGGGSRAGPGARARHRVAGARSPVQDTPRRVARARPPSAGGQAATISAARAAPRSAATNGGGGSGIASPPGGATRRGHARQHRARTASRARSASAPSVDGRSPTTTPASPKRSRTSADHRRARACPRPRASRPAAVATAATSAPGAGHAARRGSGRWRRGWWRRSGRRRAPRRDARSSASKSKSRWKPTTTASAGPSSTASSPRVGERLAHTRARAHEHAGAGRERLPRAAQAAAMALVRRRRGSAGDRRMRSSLATTSPTGDARVVRHERDPQPGGAQRGDAVGRAPGSARRPARPRRRDRSDDGRDSRAVTVSSLRPTRSQRGPVVGLVGPHRDRELEVPARADPVAGAEEAQTEAEVRVVVDRVDLDRPLELRRRPAGTGRVRK